MSLPASQLSVEDNRFICSRCRGLQPGVNYTLALVPMTSGYELLGSVSSTTFATLDTSTPVFTVGPALVTVGTTSAAFQLALSKPSTLYWGAYLGIGRRDVRSLREPRSFLGGTGA